MSAVPYARRARAAARAGDYSQSGDFYRLAGDWQRATEMYLRGGHYDLAARLAEEMGDFPSAALHYLKAGDLKAAADIELRQENRDKAAWLYRRAGQHTKAAEIFETLDQFESAAQSWEAAGLAERAGILYVKAAKYHEAVRVFEALITTTERASEETLRAEGERASLARWHRYCGELLVKMDQPSQAAPHLEAAHLLDQAAQAWKQARQPEKAAEILLRLQRPEEAYAVLRESGKDFSTLAPAVQADLLGRQGRHAEAAAILERAGSLFLAAEAFEQAGHLLRAAQLMEGEGEFERAAGLFSRAGQPAEAARLLEQAREFGNAAEQYRRAGRPEDAARVLLKAGDPVGAARIHYDRGDREASIKALQLVTPDHAEHRVAAVLLGRIFAEQGLFTLAADKFVAALDGEPVNEETAVIYYSLARAHEGNGRKREALRVYETILARAYGYEDALKRAQALRRDLEGAAPRPGDAAAPPRPGAGPGPASQEPPAAPEGARYVLGRSLGRGRVGEVFRGNDTTLGRPIAYRRLSESPSESGLAARLLQAAATAARLSHPRIAPVLDTGRDGQGPFIVSALAEGQPLRMLLRARMRFEVNRIVDIGRQVAEALDYAHGRGVLHGNLRPENIFVTHDDRVSLTDFGLTVRLSDLSPQELSSGRMIQYTAPEVLLRDRVDGRSDLYALGIILYELALGHPPFRGTDIGHQQVNEPVPPPGPGERPMPEFLKAVILKCLMKDREQRYPDAKALLQDLCLKEIVPGMVVADRYEVLAEVGRGGMGAIFRARDMEIDETVALKALGGEIDNDTAVRFVQEIKTARSVIHPNVVRVHTLEKWHDFRFIVMEYIDGVPLPRWRERVPVPSVADRLRVALQIAAGLEAAHGAGIIHRDIKPENILVTAAGQAKILDFGIARQEASGHTLTTIGTVLGTPRYMSPEQVQGKALDRRSDIYSLGAVLYFLFTGVEPFVGTDMRATLMAHLRGVERAPCDLDPTLPRALSEAILRALSVAPERRFPTAGAFAAALSTALEPRAA